LPGKRIKDCHYDVYMENQWSEEKGEELRIARIMFMWITKGLMRKKENIRKKQ